MKEEISTILRHDQLADEKLEKDQTNPRIGSGTLPLESLTKRLNLLKY
ncbi:MAG: hypothetical protein LBR79_07335 [Oscillospiraceae bacterium]|nr:hypothetical protein [Oscillospiraceae bacterium]